MERKLLFTAWLHRSHQLTLRQVSMEEIQAATKWGWPTAKECLQHANRTSCFAVVLVCAVVYRGILVSLIDLLGGGSIPRRSASKTQDRRPVDRQRARDQKKNTPVASRFAQLHLPQQGMKSVKHKRHSCYWHAQRKVLVLLLRSTMNNKLFQLTRRTARAPVKDLLEIYADGKGQLSGLGRKKEIGTQRQNDSRTSSSSRQRPKTKFQENAGEVLFLHALLFLTFEDQKSPFLSDCMEV